MLRLKCEADGFGLERYGSRWNGDTTAMDTENIFLNLINIKINFNINYGRLYNYIIISCKNTRLGKIFVKICNSNSSTFY